MDGTVDRTARRPSTTCGRPTRIKQEVSRVARYAETRRSREVRHHFQMSLFGAAKALNEGLFHVLVLGLAIYLAIYRVTDFADILTFSMLFLNVMSPLSEVHRIVDEGHEASLRVGDLLVMLASPNDPSFKTPATPRPDLNCPGPLIAVEDLRVHYVTSDGEDADVALDGLSLAIRRGEPDRH